MSIKLFLESKEPKRGIIICTDISDIIECKVGAGSYKYIPDTDKRKGKFIGEIRLRHEIEFEMIDENVIKNVKEDLSFPDLETAEKFMDKLHAIVPEEKPDKPEEVLHTIKVATGSEPNGLTEVEPGVHDVTDVEAIVKEAEERGFIKKQNQQPQKGRNAHKNKKNKLKKITQQNLKSEYNNKMAQKQAQENKKPAGRMEVDEETRQLLDQKAKFGFVPVNAKLYPKGYFLGHYYKDKDGKKCVVMVGHPAANMNESRIMIFPDEKKAKFTHESLLRHERHQKLVGLAVPHPISDIPEDKRYLDAVLVTNPLAYVNGLEVSE